MGLRRNFCVTGALCDEIFPDVSVDVGEADVSAGVKEGEFFVVETELMEDGGDDGRVESHYHKCPLLREEGRCYRFARR